MEDMEALWESYFKAGNLQGALEVSKKYLGHCRARKLCEKGLAFIDKLKKFGAYQKCHELFEIELEIFRGNKDFVLTKIQQMEEFEFLLTKQWSYWREEEAIFESCLKIAKRRLSEGRIYEHDIRSRRHIVMLIFDAVCKNPSCGLSMLEAYAQAFPLPCPLESSSATEVTSAIPEKMGDITQLLRELEKYKTKNTPPKLSSRGTNILTGIKDKDLVNNAEDIIVGLISMKLYSNALDVIEKVESNKGKNSANFLYLKVVALRMAGKYHKALDLIEDGLEELPLKSKELDGLLDEQSKILKAKDIEQGQ